MTQLELYRDCARGCHAADAVKLLLDEPQRAVWASRDVAQPAGEELIGAVGHDELADSPASGDAPDLVSNPFRSWLVMGNAHVAPNIPI
jgi:hypothetical protein